MQRRWLSLHRYIMVVRIGDMTEEWLGLAETAEIIGVHPNTLRRWGDQGLLPVHRTEGGHRRFRREDIEIWQQSRGTDGSFDVNLVIQSALWHTRFRVKEGELEAQTWYQKIDSPGREKFRRGGKEMLRGLRTYLANADAAADGEAKLVGSNYAYWAFSQKLSSIDATRAFLFFRKMLLDSVLEVCGHVAVQSPQAWAEMFRKINDYTDLILRSMLRTYEDYQQSTLR
jgi:excisionase family DNA binding protein